MGKSKNSPSMYGKTSMSNAEKGSPGVHKLYRRRFARADRQQTRNILRRQADSDALYEQLPRNRDAGSCVES
jgi:hypothetical protein